MSKKTFVVRTFNPTAADQWNASGVIEGLPGFKETVVDSEHKAVIAVGGCLLNGVGINKSDWNVVPGGSNPDDLVDVLSFVVNIGLVSDFRAYRSKFREVIKRWAEKSRVVGIRGWRASAIKTPHFLSSQDSFVGHSYDLRFKVILGTSIFYDSRTVTIGSGSDRAEVDDDISLLYKQMKRQNLPAVALRCKHSRHGKFCFI